MAEMKKVEAPMRWSYACFFAAIPFAACTGAACFVADPMLVRWLWFSGSVSAMALGVYLVNRTAESNTGF
jgi:hypothetical protein